MKRLTFAATEALVVMAKASNLSSKIFGRSLVEIHFLQNHTIVCRLLRWPKV